MSVDLELLDETRRADQRADIAAGALMQIVRRQVDRGEPIERHPLFDDALRRFAEADDTAKAARSAFLASRT